MLRRSRTRRRALAGEAGARTGDSRTSGSGEALRSEHSRAWSPIAAIPFPALWAVTLGVAALDAAWLAALRVSVEPVGFAALAGAVALLFAAGAFWTRVKPEPVLAGMAHATALLLAFTTAVAVLHYLLATLDRPLVDARLAHLESRLGFDWRAHLTFVESHPALARLLALAYHSSGPQVALVVVALSAARRFERLWTFVRLFAATLFVIIVVAALFPAEGPYKFLAGVQTATSGLETMGATWHLDALRQLRAGHVPSLALSDMRGLATFPSFHVCLALITAWALAPIRVLGPVAAAVNAAVVVATLSAGGHYLPDLLAGAAIGVGALAWPGMAARLRAQADAAELTRSAG